MKRKDFNLLLEGWQNFLNEEKKKEEKNFKFLYLYFFDLFCPKEIKSDLSEIKDRENNFGDFLVLIKFILDLKLRNNDITKDEHDEHIKKIFFFYKNKYDESIPYKMYVHSSEHGFSFSDDVLSSGELEDVKKFIKETLDNAFKNGQENFKEDKSHYNKEIEKFKKRQKVRNLNK